MLDLALVLTLSAQCAPGISPATLAAIAHAESRFNPLAIGVNRGAAVRQPRTRSEAIQVAQRLISAGTNIDLGLGQINSSNLAWLNLSIEDAFDPCRNLAAAATVLRAGYDTASWPNNPQHALRVALSRYNTGHPARGFRNGYVARVEASAARLGLIGSDASPTPGTVSSSPSRPGPPIAALPPDWDVFARSRGSPSILFTPAAPPETWSVRP